MKYKLKEEMQNYKVSQGEETQYMVNLLKARGIENLEEFVNPSENSLHCPSLLEDIEIGAELLLKHFKKASRTLLIVDSDQDGYTSSSILYLYLQNIYEDVTIDYFIHEGKQHGLCDYVKNIIDQEYDFVILPDAGSNDFDQHKELKDAGIDVLVIDHHEITDIGRDTKKNAIIINNQKGDYPNKNLSGAGVVYKFCQYLDSKLGFDFADTYLDLAAVGIVGDMMDVTDLENRYIITQGLSNIINPFLSAIVKKQSFSIGDTENITPTDISFYIAPLVNALIRVGTLEEKGMLFEAFINGDKIVDSTKRGAQGTSETLADQVTRSCVNARSRQNRTKEKALESIKIKIFNENLSDNQVIVVDVGDMDLDPNLTGLVAMQVAAEYKKPTVVAKKNIEGILKGSARGSNNSELTDLKSFFQESKFFEFAEGHPNAFGVGIKEKNLESLLKYANTKLKYIDFGQGVYETDFIIGRESEELSDIILDIAPYPVLWGQKNPEPRIVVEEIFLSSGKVEVIGSRSDTLKIIHQGVVLIAFRATKLIKEIMGKDNIKITIIGRANINHWAGISTPQIIIEDYKIESSVLDF